MFLAGYETTGHTIAYALCVNFSAACRLSTRTEAVSELSDEAMKIHRWCGRRLLISQHPETEQRVLQELDDLGLLVTKARPKPRQLEWEDLAKLPLLTCAIK